MTDPTMEFVKLFKDPKKWDKVIPRVPIFVPHAIRHKLRDPKSGEVLKDEQGNDREERVEVDEERLQRILERMLYLWEVKGVPTKWTEGHTKDPYKVDQKDQPPIHAYGINCVIGRWGPKKELGILQDLYVLPGHLDRVKEFPFRSSEFTSKLNEIDTVALLRTPPRLDMGVVHYEDDFAPGPTASPESFPAFGYVPNGETVYCYMRFDMADDPTKAPTANEPKPGGDDDFDNKFKGAMGKAYPHFDKMYAEGCKKYMTPAPPAPGGPPAPGAPPAPGGAPAGPPKVPYGEDDPLAPPHRMTPAEWKLQEQINTLKEQAEAAGYRANLAESQQIVHRLQYQEGFYLRDPDAEAVKLAKLDDEGRKERIAEIRQNYQRDPTAGDLVRDADTQQTRYGGRELSKADVQEVVHYAEDHDIDTSEGDGWEKAKQGWFKQKSMARA